MEDKNIETVRMENLFKVLTFERLKENEVKEGEQDIQVELRWERGLLKGR